MVLQRRRAKSGTSCLNAGSKELLCCGDRLELAREIDYNWQAGLVRISILRIAQECKHDYTTAI
jgi:hypothetical protein